jgi:uncharacterized protein (DUF1499 family)
MSMWLLKSLAVSSALLLAVATALVVAGQFGLFTGDRPTDLGARDGRLKPPPASPNAVSSQTDDEPHRVEPLRYAGEGAQAFARLRALVAAWPGAAIVGEADGYLCAEFTTRWLRFVDDVEFLLEPAAGVIHVRSASRLGYSDLGTNRHRVEAIRRQFASRSQP